MALVVFACMSLCVCEDDGQRTRRGPRSGRVSVEQRSQPAALKEEGSQKSSLPDRGSAAHKIYFEQGKSLLLSGKARLAIQQFESALAAQPDGVHVADCYLGLGGAYESLERTDEALKAYRTLVSTKPKDPEAYQALAFGLEHAGQLQRAVSTLRQAIALDADRLDLYQDLASLLLRLKQVDAAKGVYETYEQRRRALLDIIAKEPGKASMPDGGSPLDTNPRMRALQRISLARDPQTAAALEELVRIRDTTLRRAVVQAIGEQAFVRSREALNSYLRRLRDVEEGKLVRAALQRIEQQAVLDQQSVADRQPSQVSAEK